MTLDQLRIFVAVAEREHMTRAARHLKLTQSGVSAAIAMLESQCATPLFDRIGRQIRLTDAGRVLLQEAQDILARVEAAKAALAEIDGLQRGTLRLRASLTIAGYWLPKHLVRFSRAYPRIAVQLGIANTANVAKAVLDGDAEIGFVEGEVSDPLLRQQIVATDEMVVVVAGRHKLAQHKRIAPDDLKNLKWVLREDGSGTRSVFETALRGMGIGLSDLDVALELPSNEAIKAAVAAGAGATAISRSVVGADLANGTLKRLPLTLPLPRRAYSALYHRDRSRSRMARALLAMIAGEPPATTGR